MRSFIYALVDPNSHRVRYVGSSQKPENRFKLHLSVSRKNPRPVYAWIRSLAPKEPLLVILEEIDSRAHTVTRPDGQVESPVICAEAKWHKRFRKSELLCTIPSKRAWNELVNPGGRR